MGCRPNKPQFTLHVQMRLERSERLRNEALYKAAVTADQVYPRWPGMPHTICPGSVPQMWSATVQSCLGIVMHAASPGLHQEHPLSVLWTMCIVLTVVSVQHA